MNSAIDNNIIKMYINVKDINYINDGSDKADRFEGKCAQDG